MRHILSLLLVAVAAAFALSSCIDDDITTSPSARLSFSRDTVSFDTVFTGQGTPTARLLVFNRGKKAVSISSIAVKGGDAHFQINVDGQSGTSFSNVEIRGEDSIYVFVECLLPETAQKEPYLMEDELEFVTNGNRQSVLLEAYGQNVKRLKGLKVSSDLTLTADLPYVISDSMVVEKGATLTVEPGAKLLFHDKASLTVNGTLKARGDASHKIDMRGDRLDNVLPDASYDIMAGQWKGVRIGAESFGNEMAYVNMRSTVEGLVLDSCGNLADRKLLLENSWLHNSQGNAFTSAYTRTEAYGCVFSEAADNVVSLTGGSHIFSQCTFSNYYLFSGRFEPILGLYHIGGEDEDSPVDPAVNPYMQARFENCIVYGMTADINRPSLDATDVYLYNVLLKSEGENDEHFVDCLWDQDPLFYTEREKYIFNYRLRPDSPAINAGNPQYLNALNLYDMDGQRRGAAGNPTLGAYVYIPQDEEQE